MDFNNIRLDKEVAEPLYQQLANQLKAAMQRGELRNGEKLPPIRAWKEALGISPITATQAYERLATEGFASGQVGRGTFVRWQPPISPETQSRIVHEQFVQYDTNRLNNDFPTLINAQRTARLQRIIQTARSRYPHKDFINLTSGSPSPELFAVRRWRSAMNKAGESLEYEAEEFGYAASLQYGLALGDEPMRGWLADYLKKFEIRCQPENILLTTGSQQALDLLARTLFMPGDSVLVESPCYIAALEVFENRDVNWLPLTLDDRGIPTEGLERLIERYKPKMIYTVPVAQSPTGITLATERRAKLLELARRYNLLILEDDTCNEFYYEAETCPPALKSQDTDGRVIYFKSFSKLIFPAVRLGAIVASKPLIEKLAEAKAVFDRNTSIPLARAVLKFVDTPAFERELLTNREIYDERRNTLINGLENELAPFGCSWTKCEGGFSLIMSLPRSVRSEEFYLAAAEQGLGIAPAHILYPAIETAPTNTLRITFGDKPPATLKEAVHKLKTAMQSFQKQRPPMASGASFVAV